MIKIDVEGAELDVIKGASKLIEACHPRIIYESKKNEKEDMEKILKNYGYKIETINSSNFYAEFINKASLKGKE